jgi:hypothetical protein
MRTTLVFAFLILIYPHIAIAQEMEPAFSRSWNLDSQKTIFVLINSESEISDSKQTIIHDVIMSKKSVTLDDKNYFEGWQGALGQIYYSDDAPKLVFTDVEKPSNMIFINFVDESSKFSGLTKIILNENKIVQSHITIYNSKNLTDVEFKKILCHEFGHSLGLTHSQDINDIMFPVLEQSNQLISNNDIHELSLLYR